jgi:branched-chain amino acid transport system permease protein
MTTAQLDTPVVSRRFWSGMTLFVCALLVAPMVASQLGGNYWVRVIDFALLYVMLALGLNIVVGYTGLLDMGFIAFTPSARIWRRCWPHRICWTSSRF